MSPIKSYNHDMALANILMKELTIGVVNKVRRSDLYTGGSESPPFRTKHGRKLRQTPSEKPWSQPLMLVTISDVSHNPLRLFTTSDVSHNPLRLVTTSKVSYNP